MHHPTKPIQILSKYTYIDSTGREFFPIRVNVEQCLNGNWVSRENQTYIIFERWINNICDLSIIEHVTALNEVKFKKIIGATMSYIDEKAFDILKSVINNYYDNVGWFYCYVGKNFRCKVVGIPSLNDVIGNKRFVQPVQICKH